MNLHCWRHNSVADVIPANYLMVVMVDYYQWSHFHVRRSQEQITQLHQNKAMAWLIVMSFFFPCSESDIKMKCRPDIGKRFSSLRKKTQCWFDAGPTSARLAHDTTNIGSHNYVLCEHSSQQTQNICITFVQSRPNVFDVGPTMYKCHTNGLCLLGEGVLCRANSKSSNCLRFQ